MILIFLFVGLSFFSTAHADIEIVDSALQLKTLPGSFNSVAFSKAFNCEKSTTFFVKTGQCKLHCEFGGCEEDCKWPKLVSADFHYEDCSSDSVSIYSTLGQSIFANSNDYTAASNSIALTLIKSISLFYDAIEKIRVDQVIYPIRKNFIDEGQMKSVQLTMIAISLFPDKTKEDSYGLMISLDLDQSGLNQLMCLGSQNSCENSQDYIIKRKGLVNAFN